MASREARRVIVYWPVVGMYGLGTPADYEAFNARPSLSV